MHNYLGKTGLKVSPLCLGATVTFESDDPERRSHEIFSRYADAGGNFFDTADVYMQGQSEEILGRWLQQRRRDDFVLGTKVGFTTGDAANDEGLSRKHIFAAVENSLRRLQTEYIDLYQVHGWDPGTPLEETLTALDSLVSAGKIRYYGMSNVCGWQIQKAIDLCAHLRLQPIASLQTLYNLLDRTSEWELLPVCRQENVGILTWSPLCKGLLSGRFRRGSHEGDISPKQKEFLVRYDNDQTWTLIETLQAIASELSRTPSQIALHWLMQKSGITAPIVGPRTPEQLMDCFGIVGWELSDEQIRKLDEAGQQELPYPYDRLSFAESYRRRPS